MTAKANSPKVCKTATEVEMLTAEFPPTTTYIFPVPSDATLLGNKERGPLIHLQQQRASLSLGQVTRLFTTVCTLDWEFTRQGRNTSSLCLSSQTLSTSTFTSLMKACCPKTAYVVSILCD